MFHCRDPGHRKELGEDKERCQNLGEGDSGGPLVCRHRGNRYSVQLTTIIMIRIIIELQANDPSASVFTITEKTH